MRQKRSLGQIFLRDKKYISDILSSLSVAGRNVLEIGPGPGEITHFLAKQVKNLWCVEIDSHLYNLLDKKFSKHLNTKIINADILNFKLSQLGKEIIIFGNVPYHISSQLIEYFISYRNYIDKAYLIFQKEFVEKLLAKESQKQYGFLSCYIKYYAKVNKLFTIPATAFSPAPKVDSSFICLEFYKQPLYKVKNEEFFIEVIRKAFSSRRKKIRNSLPIAGDKNIFFSKLKIDQDLRAEKVSLKQYAAIANKLYLLRNK